MPWSCGIRHRGGWRFVAPQSVLPAIVRFTNRPPQTTNSAFPMTRIRSSTPTTSACFATVMHNSLASHQQAQPAVSETACQAPVTSTAPSFHTLTTKPLRPASSNMKHLGKQQAEVGLEGRHSVRTISNLSSSRRRSSDVEAKAWFCLSVMKSTDAIWVTLPVNEYL